MGDGARWSWTRSARGLALVVWLSIALAGCGPSAPGSESGTEPKPKALLQEARGLGAAGESERALALLESYLREHPRALGVNFTRGTLHLARAEDEAAVECFSSELALNPRHTPSLAQLGSAFERLGRFEDVVDCFRRQAELAPGDWKARYRAGTILRKYLQRPAEAEVELRAAIACHPGGIESRVELGRVCLDQGRPEEAEVIFREALQRHPEDPDAHLHLGQILVRRGETEEGGLLLERFKQLAAERDRLGQLEVAGTAPSQCQAGAAWLAKNKRRKALAAFQKAIELDPEAICGYLGMARAQRAQGRHREALAQLARARELGAEGFEVPYLSALTLAALKREAEALQVLETALLVRPLRSEEARETGAQFIASGFEASGQRFLALATSKAPPSPRTPDEKP